MCNLIVKEHTNHNVSRNNSLCKQGVFVTLTLEIVKASYSMKLRESTSLNRHIETLTHLHTAVFKFMLQRKIIVFFYFPGKYLIPTKWKSQYHSMITLSSQRLATLAQMRNVISMLMKLHLP